MKSLPTLCPICGAGICGCHHEIVRWCAIANAFEPAVLSIPFKAYVDRIEGCVSDIVNGQRHPLAAVQRYVDHWEDEGRDCIIADAIRKIGQVSGVVETQDRQQTRVLWAREPAVVRALLEDWTKALNTEPDIKDITSLIAGLFENVGVPTQQPAWVLIAGGVATGKSRLRREKYSSGYVNIDAGDIFNQLCPNGTLLFPPSSNEGELADALELIGFGIALCAVREKLNIVTEMIGGKVETMTGVIESSRSVGYKVDYRFMSCDDIAQSFQWNIDRGPSNISAFYTEPFHVRWILSAIEVLRRRTEPAQ